MAKATFKRYETDAEAQSANVVDGQFIVTKEGTAYIDYDNQRYAFGGLSYTEVLNYIYPVGSYYETTDTAFNPNVTWGGTWVLETDGTVLVSKSSTVGSIFNDDVGDVVGSETHTLTVQEIPSHNHNVYLSSGSIPSATGRILWDQNTAQEFAGSTKNTGGGQAHNIVQPSKIINRWHRTA